MAALAYDHAAALLSRFLAWAPPGRAVRRERARLGEALANAGRGADAAAALLSACEGASAEEALELRTRAGAQLLRSGLVERGLELTREVLEARGRSLARTPRGAVASMVWTRLRLAVRGRSFVPRAPRPEDAAELAHIDALTATSIGLAASTRSARRTSWARRCCARSGWASRGGPPSA